MVTIRSAAGFAGLVSFALIAVLVPPAAGQIDKPATRPAGPFGHGTGPTDAIKSMSWLAGTWNVKMTYFNGDTAVFSTTVESVIGPMLDGGFILERITVPAGPGLSNPMIGIRSFDRYRNVVRLVWFDTVTTLADVYEGAVDGGGFVVTNLNSGTSGIFAGRENHMRITQKPGATGEQFVLIWEVSGDKGKTWRKTAEYAYLRK